MALTAERHLCDSDSAAIEMCYEKGWTDGLPVVPPTRERVEAMLAAGGVEAETVLGRIPERLRTVRAEHVAINAVLAGCRPEYMSVVLAATRAILDPAFGLHGPSASTGGAGFLVIVGGPIAGAIGINNGENVLGSGTRANATIGRAVALLVRNAGGRFDRSTIGQPGKYTYCMGEQEDTGPGWEPLHQLRGLPAGTSAVTVMAASPPYFLDNHSADTAERVLRAVAQRMCIPGSYSARGANQWMALIAPEHRRILQREGLTKADVRRILFAKAHITLAGQKRAGVMPGDPLPGDDQHLIPVMSDPEDLHVLTAGGTAGMFSAVIRGWGARRSSAVITVPVAAPHVGVKS